MVRTLLKHNVRRQLGLSIGRTCARFNPELSVFGRETENLVISLSNPLRIKGEQSLNNRITAHQVDELGVDDLNTIGALGEELREHLIGDRSCFISCRDLLKTSEGGLNGVAPIGEIADGFTTDQHQINLVPLALKLSKTRLSAFDDVGVVAATETSVAGDSDKSDGLDIALLEKGSISIFETHACLEVFKQTSEPIRKWATAQDLLLSAPNLGRSHETHGLSDLAGVLDRFDPISDLLQICHVSGPQLAEANMVEVTSEIASLRMVSASGLSTFSS